MRMFLVILLALMCVPNAYGEQAAEIEDLIEKEEEINVSDGGTIRLEEKSRYANMKALGGLGLALAGVYLVGESSKIVRVDKGCGFRSSFDGDCLWNDYEDTEPNKHLFVPGLVATAVGIYLFNVGLVEGSKYRSAIQFKEAEGARREKKRNYQFALLPRGKNGFMGGLRWTF